MQVLVQYLETPIDHPKEGVMVVGRDHFENAYTQISFNAHDKVSAAYRTIFRLNQSFDRKVMPGCVFRETSLNFTMYTCQVQLSTPQGPSDQPQWYHSFLFQACIPNQNIGILLFHQPFINSQTVRLVAYNLQFIL